MINNNEDDMGATKQMMKKSNSDLRIVPPQFGRSQSIDHSYKYQLEEKDKTIAMLKQATEVSQTNSLWF